MDDTMPPGRKKQTGSKKPGVSKQKMLDDTLWAMETADVQRLNSVTEEANAEPEALETPVSKPDRFAFDDGSQSQATILTSREGASRPQLRKPTSRAASTVDKRTAEKIRRGKMTVEAKIDLHGMNRLEAEDALRGFIARSRERSLRLVLVITGKGGLSADPLKRGGGVLRQFVPQWLREEPLVRDVLYVSEAKPKDGGSGALYVYLKRDRT